MGVNVLLQLKRKEADPSLILGSGSIWQKIGRAFFSPWIRCFDIFTIRGFAVSHLFFWQAVDAFDACVLQAFYQQFCDCLCHGLLPTFGVFESNRRLREGIPVSLIAHAFVSVLPGLEGLIEIDAFGRRDAKSRELLGRNFEVAIDASFAAIDDGEGTGFVVVGHGGDDAGGHQGINSRKLEMQ
jgi:hypothetical protein